MEEECVPPATGGVVRLVTVALDKAIGLPAGMIARNVDRLRRRHTSGGDRHVVRALERQYLATVTSTGAGAGASAAAPGVGTGVALALTAGEFATFTAASALYALSVAHVHGVRVDDLERRRALVLAVMLGDVGAETVQKAARTSGAYWGRRLTKALPMETVNRINGVLGPRFVTKYGTKQGVIVVGRVLPFGIGALIGGSANMAIGYGVVRAVRSAFGPAPDQATSQAVHRDPGVADDPVPGRGPEDEGPERHWTS